MTQDPTHMDFAETEEVGTEEVGIEEVSMEEFEVVDGEFGEVGDALATADPRVDDAVARLAELRELPTADHVAVYEDIHSRLHDALADLGDPAAPRRG